MSDKSSSSSSQPQPQPPPPQQQQQQSQKETKRIGPFIYKDPHKGVTHKTTYCYSPVKEGEFRTVNIITCIAKDSLTKCKGQSINTERVFIKGDTVDIIYISLQDYYDVSDKRVWFVVIKNKGNKLRKRLWMRNIELLRPKLDVVEIKEVPLYAVEHGYVRGKNGISDSIKCTSYMVHDTFKIWIEDGDYGENNLIISNYDDEEEEEEEGENKENEKAKIKDETKDTEEIKAVKEEEKEENGSIKSAISSYFLPGDDWDFDDIDYFDDLL